MNFRDIKKIKNNIQAYDYYGVLRRKLCACGNNVEKLKIVDEKILELKTEFQGIHLFGIFTAIAEKHIANKNLRQEILDELKTAKNLQVYLADYFIVGLKDPKTGKEYF